MKIIFKNRLLLFLIFFFLIIRIVSGQDILLESFDGETFPPENWTQVQISETGLWDRVTEGYNPTCSPQSGEGMIYFNSYSFDPGTMAALISPSIDLTDKAGVKFRFWMYRDQLYEDRLDAVDIYINTSNTIEDAHLLGTIYRPSSSEPSVSSDGWYEYFFDIPSSFNGSVNYFFIKGTSQYGNNIFVDNIRVYIPEPADSPPISFSPDIITASSMEVAWIDNSTNEIGFRVYISTDNETFTQYGDDIESTTQQETGTEYSKIITDLLPGTTYYFRISAYADIDSDFLTGQATTLPPGDITSLSNGNWNDPATWDSGTVPTSTDNVIIAEGHTVTLDATGDFNSLTVEGDLSLQPYLLSGRNVTVTVTGSIYVVSGVNANLSVSGDIVNNGSMDFYISETVFGRISFSGSDAQIFDAAGTTNIGDIAVNKGNSYNNIIELKANGTFSIKGGSDTNFLILSDGTFKISGSASVSNNVFPSIGYTIPSTAGFWLNNSNFEVLGQNAPTQNNGLIRLTAGTYNIGNTSNNALAAGNGAKFILEGGILNIAGRFYTANAIDFTLTNAEINVNLLGNTSNNESFGLVSSSNTINISGGTINIVRASEGSIPLDYNLQGSIISITGGTLNVGAETTPSPYTFRIRGNTPSLVIDNTGNAKTALLTASTNVYGDITVKSGSTLNAQTYTIQVIGNINSNGDVVNDGLITNSSATGSNFFSFIGEHGAQTLTGSGTMGDATTPFAGISFSNSAGVSVQSAIVTNRANLLKGNVTGSNNITLGNGEGSTPIVQRGGISASIVGAFDQSPVISSGSSYGVTYSLGLEPFTTGSELPSAISGTLLLETNVDVTIGAPASVEKLSFASTNVGKVITSQANLLTISGTSPSDLVMAEGNSGYVIGPLARTLPTSLETGTTYLYPIGKSGKNYFELVNPTTLADGNVVISAEVFDEGRAGTEGTNIKAGSLGERYWKAQFALGEENFSSTNVRVTQSAPLLDEESGLALSADLEGSYNLISSDFPVDNTIKSDEIVNMGYFAIGGKEVAQSYISSTTTQTNTDIVFQGDENMLIIGVEIVTSGNEPALEVTNIEFNTNGTNDVTDIANAKLFYTGTSSTFSATQQVGETFSTPDGIFSINLSQELLEGTNYFWLTYDIAENATDKNLVDAECNSITIGGETKTPDISAPTGNRIIRTGLSGTYLVGVSEDYETITEAISDLNLVGVKGSVVFALTNEEYSINETFPITVEEITNSTADNWVIIKPATDVSPIITGNSSNPIFLVNASNFGIDGSNTIEGTSRDLTIINDGTGTSSGIILSANNGNNVSYKNIIGVGGLTNAGFGIALDGIENAVIENCQISKVNIGILSQGSSNQILIEGNDIGSSNAADKVHTTGIDIDNTSGFSIASNNIVGVSSASTATASGIKISGNSSNGTINGNTIRNIKNTQSTGYGSNGIWLNSSNTNSQIKFYNNLISDVASEGYNGWNVGDNGYGLVIDGGGGYGIYYNTILLNTDQAKTRNTSGINITSGVTTANSLDIRNNIIFSTQTKGTRYAVYCAAPNTVFANIDHNNYHAPTGVGFIGGSARTSLANWQTGTQKDANSLNVLPYFTSDTDLSLINNMNCPLDGAGTPIALVTTDFNGDERDAVAPDMGAFEFTTVPFAAPAAEFDEVCYGETSGLLTLTEYEGTITGWESSVSPFTEWFPIENTLDTYTSDALLENTRFRTILSHGSCTNFPTEYVEVAVSPATVGGAVSGGSDICTGQTSELLTLEDHVGNVIRWESSVDPFDTWIPIENTLETYTSEALTETTRFRAVVKSGVCDEQPCDYTEVIVFPLSVGGSVTGGTTICSGQPSSELTLSGNIGDVVRWEFSQNETDWTEIANTEITYISDILTQTTYFRAVVQSGPCSEAASEHTTVTVDPPSVGGAVTGGTSICSGQNSGVLTLSGHTGEVVRWESSVSPFDSWTSIDNTQETFTSNPLTEVTRFRAVVQSGVCTEAASDYSEVTISPPTVGGSVTGGTAICEGEISDMLTLSGHTGDIVKWQFSVDEVEWTDIANTDDTYISRILTQTTYFRAVVKSGGCEALESDHTTVMVNLLPDAAIASTDALAYCEGDEISTTFSAEPVGGIYRWFKDEVQIDGETDNTYTATAVGSYTAEVTVNGCSAISNAEVIVVNPLPDATISTTNALTYCEGEPISVEFTATPADGIYRWFKDDVLIDDATSQTHTATSAGTYAAEVTLDGCSATSNEIVVETIDNPNPTISTEDALSICEGEQINVEFEVDIAEADLYQWLLNGEAIGGANNNTYTATEVGVYSVEVEVNGCTGISNELTVSLVEVPEPFITTDDPLTWCVDSDISVTFEVDIDNPDAIYQWLLDNNTIDGANGSTYIATEAGSYTVEVTIDGCSGVSNEIVVETTEELSPVLSTTDELSWCTGDEITVVFSVDITTADTYQWYLNGELIDDATTSSYEANTQGVYWVEVFIGSCSGITNQLEIVVNETPQPYIFTSDQTSWCEGSEISVLFEVDIDDADGYQWMRNNSPIDGDTGNTFIATQAGEYTVEVTVDGCTGVSNLIEVIEDDELYPVISTDDPLVHCDGEDFTVTFYVDIPNADAYQWFDNDYPLENETSNTLAVSQSGSYWVLVTQGACTGASNDIEVFVMPSPTISLASDTVYITVDDEYLFEVDDIYESYLWFDGTTEHSYLFAGSDWGVGLFEVWVEVTNEFSCSTRDTAIVIVGPTGIDSHSILALKLYPNPTDGHLNIMLDGLSSTNPITISIHNISGKLVHQKVYRPVGEELRAEVNIADKAKGVYMVTITDGKNKVTRRVVLE